MSNQERLMTEDERFFFTGTNMPANPEDEVMTLATIYLPRALDKRLKEEAVAVGKTAPQVISETLYTAVKGMGI